MAPTTRTKRRPRGGAPRFRAAALLLLGVAAAALLLHAAVARRLLATPALRRLLNTTPSTSAFDWKEAVSIVPGRVRLRGFSLYGNDGNVEWTLELEAARLTYSVPELLARRFHVTSLTGSGLSFRVRPAPPPEPGTAARSAGGNPWTVRVDGIAIERLSEIAIDAYRFAGRARVTGRFRLTPHREAEVGPAEISIDAGELRLFGDPMLAIDPGSRIACRIAPWDPRLLPGNAVWRNVSGNVRWNGTVPGVAFLNRYAGESSDVRFAGGRGRARVEAAVDRGVAAGAVRLAAADVRAAAGKTRLTGDARVAARVVRWPLEKGAVDLSGSRVDLSKVGSDGDATRGWWGAFAFPRASWHGGFRARVEAKCRDARPLLAVADAEPPKWTRKALAMEGLALTADVSTGPRRFAVRTLDAKGGSLHVEGDYAKAANRADGVFWIDAGKINVGLSVENGRSRWRPIPTRKWFERRRDDVGRESARYPARSTTTAVP